MFITAVYFLYLIPYYYSHQEPFDDCYFGGDQSISSVEFSKKLCFIGIFYPSLNIPGIQIVFTKDISYAERICDVVIYFNKTSSIVRNRCPGTCHPKPSLAFSVDFWEQAFEHIQSVTCSLSSDMLAQFNLNNTKWDFDLSKVLEIVYYRRIQECSEEVYWKYYVPQEYKVRRDADGIVIWIGAKHNREQLILQESALYDYHIKGNHQITGWLATEEIYNCRNSTFLCNNSNANGVYLPHMPTTGTADKAAGG